MTNRIYILLIFLSLTSCNNNSEKRAVDPKKDIIKKETQKESAEYLIDSAFNNWKSDEIKLGRMQAKCPAYGTEEFRNFIEEPHDNNNRWAYTKTLKKLYTDFNEDGISDGLIVFEREDCEQGNGYVGDNQVPVLFLSKGDSYQKDETIIADMQNAIDSKALGLQLPQVAYIEVQSVEKNNINGIYLDWQEGDPTGQPSVKKMFSYNYKTHDIKVQ